MTPAVELVLLATQYPTEKLLPASDTPP